MFDIFSQLNSKLSFIKNHARKRLEDISWHQGTRGYFALDAINWIGNTRLLNDNIDSNTAKDIMLFVLLAVGEPSDYFWDGFTINNMKKYSDSENMDFYIKCYNNAGQYTDKLLNLCLASTEDVRIASLYALSWFGEHWEKTVKFIQENINKVQSDSEVANMLFCLSMLFDYSNISCYDIKFNNSSKIVAISRLIGVIRERHFDCHEDIFLKLLKLLPVEDNYNIPWNDGWIIGLLSEIIDQIPCFKCELLFEHVLNNYKLFFRAEYRIILYSLLKNVFNNSSQQKHIVYENQLINFVKNKIILGNIILDECVIEIIADYLPEDITLSIMR